MVYGAPLLLAGSSGVLFFRDFNKLGQGLPGKLSQRRYARGERRCSTTEVLIQESQACRSEAVEDSLTRRGFPPAGLT